MIAISQPPPTIVKRAMIKTGTYIGTGVDNRNIDIGVDLAAKLNVYLIVKARSTGTAMHRTEYGQGDLTMYYGGINDPDNTIQAFTSTGFQVGTNSNANSNGITYRYIAFWEEP